MLKDFSRDKFDVIILAGQSNAAGFGYGTVETPYEPDDSVWFLNEDFTISVAKEHASMEKAPPYNMYAAGDLSLTFALSYMDCGMPEAGRKLLIARHSIGGAGFSTGQWGTDGPMTLRLLEMIRTALDLNPENKAIAMLWQQGEVDAFNRLAPESYRNGLLTLLAAVRATSRNARLPFLAGDFVQQWKNENLDISAPIVSEIQRVCSEDANAAFVGTEGLESNNQKVGTEDKIHFCREALHRLGRRYFKAFCSMAA